MNILTGVLPRDGGTIEFDGQKLEHITITQSEKMGIAFVHQELNLFNELKVFENMFLNREYTNRIGTLNKKRMRAEARELFERLGVEIDPDAVVSDLKTSQKLLLEICKALHLKAKLIILDEPTTSLNNEEVDHLFGILRKLKADGTSFIFISHKMPEIFALADRYTVFRNGEYIGEGKISDTTPEKVTVMMVGESYSNAEVYEKRPLGEEALKLEGFTGDGFHDINLSVKKGEIVGMTGLQGSGSSEMLQAIFGSTRATVGTVSVFGKSVPHNSIHSAMKAGIAMLPNNRKENSVLPDMSLMENMAISEQTLSAARLPVETKRDKKRYSFIFVLIVIFIVYAITSSGLTWSGVMNIFRHSAVIGTVALGMGLICLTGEIDLSVGSMLALTAGFSVIVFNITGSILLTLLFALGFGAVCGFVNGLLVGGVQMPAFIVTLATMLIYRSFAQYFCQHMDRALIGGGSSVYKMDTAKAAYNTLFGFGNGKIATIPTVGIVMLLIIRDAVMWHVVPLIVITALAEIVRAMAKYRLAGDIVATVLMSFSSFGYYGQIWFNRAYTYECAVEEMPAGYGDTLMSVSPVWAFPVVVAAGIIVSVLITNAYMKKHTGIDK